MHTLLGTSFLLNIRSRDPFSVPPKFRYMPNGLGGEVSFHEEAFSALRTSILLKTGCAGSHEYLAAYSPPELFTTLKITPKHAGTGNIHLRAVSNFQKNGPWYDNVSVSILEDDVGEVRYAAQIVWFVTLDPLPDNDNSGNLCYIF